MRVFRPALLLIALLIAATATAQRRPPIDFSISFVAERANPVAIPSNFWMQGGSAELGTNLWHGFGIAAKGSGTHTASFGPNAIPLTLFTTTLGPRYRYTRRSMGHELSVFGEGLFGAAYGVSSIFPSPTGLTTNAYSFASEVGGGVDLSLSRHFALRAIQSTWVRTQLPNSTTSVQNNLQLGAGLVVKF